MQTDPVLKHQSTSLSAIACPDQGHTVRCYAVGANSKGAGVVVALSEPSSAWSGLNLPAGTGPLSAISWTSTGSCSAAGTTGAFAAEVLTTVNGGGRWATNALPSYSAILNDVACCKTALCVATDAQDTGPATANPAQSGIILELAKG